MVTERQITKYVTFDGKIFDNYEAAHDYEYDASIKLEREIRDEFEKHFKNTSWYVGVDEPIIDDVISCILSDPKFFLGHLYRLEGLS